MVLGVNVRNYDNDCGTYPGTGPQNYYDNIYFVSFKNITDGTTIQITDNRYINNNNFSNTEGFLSLERTGGTITAGTVFKLDIPSSYSVGTVINGWKIVYRHNSFALSGSGEQFFVFQNANWNTAGSVSGTDLKYLLAYNSKRDWLNTANTYNSLLPTSGANNLSCYHISSPNNTTRNFAYYSGPTIANISQGEWLVRILNNANWTNAPYCANFNTSVFTGTLPIKTTIPEQEICSGENLTTLEVVNESNVVKYQWYSNTTANNSGGTPIPGVNSYTYTPSNTAIGTTYYYCEMLIDLPLNGTSNTTDCAFVSNVFKVTVNDNPRTSPVISL